MISTGKNMQRISDLEKKYVAEVLENEFQTSKNNIFNARLEQEFCKVFNTSFSIGHVNGTATMHTALAALGVGPGDEVIVTPLTMASTSLCVLHAGALPVFADVNKQTFTIDPEDIARKITPKTKAIITVSLYGLSPDYDPILELCKKHGIALIEDNAECFLGYYKGKVIGSFGEFSSYSFQASKHITSGEGGMLTTNDEALADKARRFSGLGYGTLSAKKGKISREEIQSPDYIRHVAYGYNYRMSELCAAVALGQIERLEAFVEQRQKIAALFDEAIKGFESVLTVQHTPEDYVNSFFRCVLLCLMRPLKALSQC